LLLNVYACFDKKISCELAGHLDVTSLSYSVVAGVWAGLFLPAFGKRGGQFLKNLQFILLCIKCTLEFKKQGLFVIILVHPES